MSTEPTFVEFFESAHPGRGPFPWQERLAASMVNNKWVDWITVPTGLGKTAIIDAWAYALARSAHAHGPQRHVPTRLIFVVNRRGIVDDSFRYAEALANILRTAGAPETPVGWVASQLRQLGFQLQQPLDAVRMRGGVSWDWRWLRQPDQPAVVSSTVGLLANCFNTSRSHTTPSNHQWPKSSVSYADEITPNWPDSS